MGNEDPRYYEPSDHVSENNLQERQVAPIGHARNTDDGQCARLRGDDREHDRPPGNVTVGEKIIFEGALFLAELQSERGDAREIKDNDEQVQPVKAHLVSHYT